MVYNCVFSVYLQSTQIKVQHTRSQCACWNYRSYADNTELSQRVRMGIYTRNTFMYYVCGCVSL